MAHESTFAAFWRRLRDRFGRKSPEPARRVGPARAGADHRPRAGDDLFGDEAIRLIAPGLKPDERLAAQREGSDGLPETVSPTASQGELQVRQRFEETFDRLWRRGYKGHEALCQERDEALGQMREIEVGARTCREKIQAFPAPHPDRDSIDRCYREEQDAKQELRQFRSEHELSDSASPQSALPRWWVWLAVFLLVETLVNGYMIYSGTGQSLPMSWLFAALISGATVGVLGWFLSDLIFRRWRFAARWLRAALVTGLLAAGGFFVVLHSGFAHYRDAAVALAESGAAADGFGPGDLFDPDSSESGSLATNAIGIDRAVLGELRAQFGLAGPESGYEARNGELFRTHDPHAGRFDGWQSLLLFLIGGFALVLAVWKWYWRDEPIPGWAQRHRKVQEARNRLDAAYRHALESSAREERAHYQCLDAFETSLEGLVTSLHRAGQRREHLVTREAELLDLTVEAGTAAVEDYRAENRAQRPVAKNPPAFWDVPWSPPRRQRNRDAGGWKDDDRKGLDEVREVLGRVRKANKAHRPAARAAYRAQRDQFASAARRAAPEAEPASSPRATAPGEPAPSEAELPLSRLRAAS